MLLSKSSENTATFKIAMCGPSRVGKTSIITALLQEAQTIFSKASSMLELVPDTKTEKLIHRQVNALKGSIRAGEFNPGALSGTQSSNKFILDLTMKIEKKWYEKFFSDEDLNRSIRWAILDYPGAWLIGNTPPPKEDWDYCEKWINESRVLIIPIDAAVLMESKRPIEVRAQDFVLGLSEAETLAKKWALGRCEANENGMLILAPVKCETYFSDNGGYFEKSMDLERISKEFYKHLIRLVKDQCGQKVSLSVQYHPIDTIGCVEIKDSKWIKIDSYSGEEGNDGDGDPGIEFQADYEVRRGQDYKPLGAADLLLEICKEIITSRQAEGLGSWFPILNFLDKVPQLKREIEKVIASREQLKVNRRIKKI